MAWDRHRRVGACCAAVVALVFGSCSDDGDDGSDLGESRGELGFADFQWDCVSRADAQCDALVLPRFVANGAEFSLTFTRAGGLPDSVGLSGVESASPNIIDDSFGALRAVRPGVVAVLALGTDDNVVDYVNLLVLDTDRIAIRAAEQQPSCADIDCYDVVGEGGAFILVPGQPVNVLPQPFAHGQLLGGALQYTWESQDPEVLAVEDGFDGQATLTPLAVGDATLLVSGGGITQVIALHVMEPPPLPDDGTTGEPDTTTGTETGSGTDTGSGTGGSGTDGSGSSTGTDTGTGSGSTTGGM